KSEPGVLRQEGFEEPRPRLMPEPRERPLLDLSDPLTGDAEALPDLLQSERFGIAEPEVEPQDLRFTLAEGTQRIVDGSLQRLRIQLVVGAGGELIGDVVQQLPILPRHQRRIEREVRLRHREGVLDLLLREVQLLRDLLERGFPPELLGQGGGALADPVKRPRPTERHTYDPRLLRESLEDRLADPPDGVGDEL